MHCIEYRKFPQKFSIVMWIEGHSLAHVYTLTIINPLYMGYNFFLVFS